MSSADETVEHAEYEHLVRLEEDERLALLARLHRRVRRTDDEVSFVAGDGWVAAPVEGAIHFDDHDVARILAVLSSGDNREALMEAEGKDAYRVPATPAALEEVNVVYGLFDITLCPPDLSWVIFASQHDFFVVMGPVKTVEALVGIGLTQALERYPESMEYWIPKFRVIRATTEAHWASFPTLQPGETITIPLKSGPEEPGG